MSGRRRVKKMKKLKKKWAYVSEDSKQKNNQNILEVFVPVGNVKKLHTFLNIISAKKLWVFRSDPNGEEAGGAASPAYR